MIVEREHCLTTERLTARKTHYCATGSGSCTGPICPGEVYLRHTAFPGHDAAAANRPESIAECAGCATRYGRGHLLGLHHAAVSGSNPRGTSVACDTTSAAAEPGGADPAGGT